LLNQINIFIKIKKYNLSLEYLAVKHVNFDEIVLKNWKNEIEVEFTIPKALNYFKNNHLVPN